MINKIPQPKTIARHYSQGRLCDYPAETVLSAINSYDYKYDSVTIPVRPTFGTIIFSNFEFFAYLANHNSQPEIETFLANPNEFVSASGIPTVLPLDDDSAYIMAMLVEPELLALLRSDDALAVMHFVYSPDWTARHTRKFHNGYCTIDAFWNLDDCCKSHNDIQFTEYGFTRKFHLQLECILLSMRI